MSTDRSGRAGQPRERSGRAGWLRAAAGRVAAVASESGRRSVRSLASLAEPAPAPPEPAPLPAPVATEPGPGTSASPAGAGTVTEPAGPSDAPGRVWLAGPSSADAQVPLPLRAAAAWCWRLLLVAAVVYLTFKVVVALRLLVLPFIAALLLCALLQPLVAWLSRQFAKEPAAAAAVAAVSPEYYLSSETPTPSDAAGGGATVADRARADAASRERQSYLPKLAATWLVLLVAIGVLVGAGFLITSQVQSGYPQLSSEVVTTVHRVLRELSRPPFRLNGASLDQLTNRLVNYLEQHKTVVAGTVLTGGKYFLEVLAGFILTIFITFFLLKDGDKLWAGLIHGFENFRHGRSQSPAKDAAIERSNKASGAAWQA